ncbi:MAG: PEP-CTERM sorting domain-containing protein [Microcystis aeruginosa PMC 728.11]|nr:PEP-CTERM sorting domain-containing protein [Microcystis aeruginosa PMC 728.11]
MTNQLLKALCLPAVTCAVFSAIPAHAAIFTATYTGTVSENFGVDNVAAGNTAVITYQLDNGGSSLLSQTWNASNIVSVTFNFGNGAHVTTFDPNGVGGNGLTVSTGSFVTNASGQLTAVPSNWSDDSNLNVVSTNSTQTPFSWFVNGGNGVYYTDNGDVSLTNVAGNIVAANWTIQGTQTQTTPEPGTVLGLLAVGSLGLLARKRQ